MIEIVSLHEDDTIDVAHAHFDHLRSRYTHRAWSSMLKIYYEVVASLPGGACGYVAKVDGKFAGYVCGVWDNKSLRNALLKQWIRLAHAAFRYIIADPKVFLLISRRLLGGKKSNHSAKEGYELRPIVVLPEYRGMGVADQLVMRLLEDARQREFGEVFLYTEFDNIPAAKFYTRMGFRLEQDLNIDGEAYKLFAYTLS